MKRTIGNIIGEVNFNDATVEGSTHEGQEIKATIKFLDTTNADEMVNGQKVVAKLSITDSDGEVIDELEITSIIRTDKSIIFLISDGTVYGCGENGYCELGGIEDKKFITKVTKFPVSNVKKVVTGLNHTMFLLNNGLVKACGRNYEGQLGIGHFKARPGIFDVPINNVKEIYCGQHNTMFVLNSGVVMGCGYNEHGQLGIDNDENQPKIVKIPITDVSYISMSRTNTIFMMPDGTMKACGSNRYGELGIGDNDLEGVDDIIDLPFEIEKGEN